MITKALIIDEPWISKILSGAKVWEMRSAPTCFRGTFGLIRKGSGQVVGTATLHEVSGPHNSKALEACADKHCIGKEIYSGEGYRWRYAWHLEDARRFPEPVRYRHRSGAVTWVALDEDVSRAIAAQIAGAKIEREKPLNTEVDKNATAEVEVEAEMSRLFGNSIANSSTNIKDNEDSQVASTTTSGRSNNSIGARLKEQTTAVDQQHAQTSDEKICLTLTQGNINNAHFYIPRHTQLLPDDAWGGKNKTEAGKPITVTFGDFGDPIETDIDSTKRILRARAPIRRFFRDVQASAGDEICITRLSAREFRVDFTRCRHI